MKVSIITIVYNNQAFIESCIHSVLNQIYPNIEHIVIDGGSTDGTQKKIEQYKDQLAYYKSEKDKGLYDGLNKGIRQATGDIVGILHSDDLYYDTESIQKVVDAFKLSNSGSVIISDLINKILDSSLFNCSNISFKPVYSKLDKFRKLKNVSFLYNLTT